MAMTQSDLLALLDRLGVAHSTVEHQPVFRVGEGEDIKARMPGAHTKNLFLKDKKDQLWLVSAQDRAVIDLKSLPALIGSARLSFGSAERLWDALGVRPGSVSAFALAYDTGRRVRFVLDKALADAPVVNFHPMVNTATTAVSADGLRCFLAGIGVEPLVVDFTCGPASDGR